MRLRVVGGLASSMEGWLGIDGYRTLLLAIIWEGVRTGRGEVFLGWNCCSIFFCLLWEGSSIRVAANCREVPEGIIPPAAAIAMKTANSAYNHYYSVPSLAVFYCSFLLLLLMILYR